MRKLTVQELALIVDNYLADNYDFRNNCISGKSEVRRKANLESPVGEWQVVTTKVLNSIVRKAEMDGVGDTTSPQKFILQYINSDAIPAYDPVNEYLDGLLSGMERIMWRSSSVAFLESRKNSVDGALLGSVRL